MLTSWSIIILSLALCLVTARVQYLERQVKDMRRTMHEEAKHNNMQISGILRVLCSMYGVDVDAILAEGRKK